MQEISIKDIADFCWCPKYYDLKRNDPAGRNIRQLYDESLHKVFYSYLHMLQNGGIQKPVSILKRLWGKEWVKPKRNSQIVCTPSAATRDYYDAKRKAGINAILSFNELMQQHEQFPVIINMPYSLKVTSKVTVTGVFEYVREIGDGGSSDIQVIKFRTEGNRFHTTNASLHDIELTSASLAFMENFNTGPFSVVYADVYQKKMVQSARTKTDYDMFRRTAASVAYCIRHGIRCISPDTRCYHCEYRNICKDSMEKH